jgi:hypothetical protein
MMMRPFGQLGRWALFRSARRILPSLDYDDDCKHVWPTWAGGALFRGVRRVQLSRLYDDDDDNVSIWPT